MAAYCGSEFGLEGFSESPAQDVRHLGIKVTILQPACCRTEFRTGAVDRRIPCPTSTAPPTRLSRSPPPTSRPYGSPSGTGSSSCAADSPRGSGSTTTGND
ncbi:hypothetical protein ABZ490_33195 [Streptomyces sp. NPDC005811]|uniref:hypothetical protein n=1 Tax=Streptomyces sp. NPDC005811 TaxID=3154565 RepID=UPI0034098795